MRASKSESNRRWKQKNPEAVAKHKRAHRKAHPELDKEIEKRCRDKLRRDVITHYSGGALQCAKCGTEDYRVLEIDHINGGGQQHRRELSPGGQSVYRELRKNGFPEGYRVLCRNCNWIARLEIKEEVMNERREA